MTCHNDLYGCRGCAAADDLSMTTEVSPLNIHWCESSKAHDPFWRRYLHGPSDRSISIIHSADTYFLHLTVSNSRSFAPARGRFSRFMSVNVSSLTKSTSLIRLQVALGRGGRSIFEFKLFSASMMSTRYRASFAGPAPQPACSIATPPPVRDTDIFPGPAHPIHRLVSEQR